MFDTIKAWLTTNETANLETVLSGYEERVNPKTGDLRQWGELNGLRVSAGGYGLTIEGSLPKYHLGNNLETLTRSATRQAIEQLSDTLHQPIEQARVCRFDVAQNFIMKKPVIEYLSALNGARYYKRSDFADRETVTFHNTMRSFCFYDKARELEKNKEEIPDFFKGKHILRRAGGRGLYISIITLKGIWGEIPLIRLHNRI